MIEGVSSNASYRNQWASQLTRSGESDGSGESAGATESTGSTGQVWDAVFTDESENMVSVNDFLNLMVVQLQNQDFMNPVDDTQFVTQLAQFATMQQMQEMATYMKTNYVMSLVGKNVTAARFSVSGALEQETGTVEKISLVNNEYAIYVNGKQFSLEQIMEIHEGGAVSDTETDGETQDPAEMAYLLSLIGKEVTVQQRDADGNPTGTITGVVERVSAEDGLYIGGSWYPLEDVTEITGASEPEEELPPEEEPDGTEETPAPGTDEGAGEVTGGGETDPTHPEEGEGSATAEPDSETDPEPTPSETEDAAAGTA